MSGRPWAALAALENLDLSSNRLRTLGDVVLMTWLRRLNLENNEINPVPLELGLCAGGIHQKIIFEISAVFDVFVMPRLREECDRVSIRGGALCCDITILQLFRDQIFLKNKKCFSKEM